MRVLFILLTILLAESASAGNLSMDDYFATWSSDWSAVKGEKQTLQINSDSKSKFVRVFANGKKQEYQSDKIEMVDDLLVLKYTDINGDLICKLVLSGWKAHETKKIYGTMYMYKDGVQFNGLPVTFSSR